MHLIAQAFAQGTIDQEGTLSGRLNYGWPTASGKTKDTSKVNLQARRHTRRIS